MPAGTPVPPESDDVPVVGSGVTFAAGTAIAGMISAAGAPADGCAGSALGDSACGGPA